MRAPAFWWRPAPSPLAQLLRPVSFLYGLIAAGRMRRSGAQAAVPVICVGNFTVGGAGKTPTAVAIARMLQAKGEHPAFLSRGYGGSLAGPIRVEARHGAAEVGDEPLLLGRTAPTIVSRDRLAGARLAAKHGATVIVMDDGLQNPSLHKDLALAVVDGATGLGNRRALPAGPLRAPLDAQWPRVDAVLVIGEGAAGEAAAREAGGLGKTVMRGRLVADPDAAAALQGRRVLAFAGIGRPEKFFDTVRAGGAIVEVARAFPDHHPFAAGELAGLAEEAAARGLLLVTTEKDAARLGASGSSVPIATLPVALQVSDEAALARLVETALANARQAL